jgi:hypothetical protein
MAKTLKSVLKVIEKVAANNTFVYHGTFAVNMTGKIARDTPVKTGRATANWILKAGSPNLSPVRMKDPSVTAALTIQKAEKAARTAPKKTALYISNAVQGQDDNNNFTGEGYIVDLERGKSVQSPAGMMFQKNVALAPQISANSLKEIFR